MPVLEEFQSAFLASIRGQQSQISFGPSKIPSDQTWQIYRRNYRETHVAALGDTYSTVRSLVGDSYFRQLAIAYVKIADSHSGDLNDYGAGFADFLAQPPGNNALPYLPDMARVDWAWFQALRFAHGPGNWLAKLLGSPPEHWPLAKATPACCLLRSDFPIHRIWELAAKGGETVNLDQGGESMLISRPSHVEVSLLSAAEAAFLACWLNGSTLETGLEAALAVDGQFDIASHLTRLAALGAIHSIESES